MPRRQFNEKTYRAAAERLATFWLRKAGVPRHFFGFTSDEGFYLILEGYTGKDVRQYCVPCAGARVLRKIIDEFVRDRSRVSCDLIMQEAQKIGWE